MTRRRMLAFALALLAVFATAAGCSRPGRDEAGVVARVNGRPITLAMVEFQYDLEHFEALTGQMPSVSALREAYGEILGQLVAQELVAQELAKRGQDVTDEELKAAETRIRADYPGDSFQKMLADEYIDLSMWRRHLRYSCGLEKFQRLVLRPSIHLDYRDVEAYYRTHLDAFRLPERVRLLVVMTTDRALATRVLAAHARTPDAAALQAAYPAAQVREMTIARELLVPSWAEALRDGDAAATGKGVVVPDRLGFEGLLLLERLPAQTLDIAQAYPRVEAALVDERLQQAFEVWLAKAVDASVIRVSARLLHKRTDEDLPPEPQDNDTDKPDVASGNETG